MLAQLIIKYRKWLKNTGYESLDYWYKSYSEVTESYTGYRAYALPSITEILCNSSCVFTLPDIIEFSEYPPIPKPVYCVSKEKYDKETQNSYKVQIRTECKFSQTEWERIVDKGTLNSPLIKKDVVNLVEEMNNIRDFTRPSKTRDKRAVKAKIKDWDTDDFRNCPCCDPHNDIFASCIDEAIYWDRTDWNIKDIEKLMKDVITEEFVDEFVEFYRDPEKFVDPARSRHEYAYPKIEYSEGVHGRTNRKKDLKKAYNRAVRHKNKELVNAWGADVEDKEVRIIGNEIEFLSVW